MGFTFKLSGGKILPLCEFHLSGTEKWVVTEFSKVVRDNRKLETSMLQTSFSIRKVRTFLGFLTSCCFIP